MGQGVIHPGPRQRLAILVVNKTFKKRPANTLGDTASDLPFDLRWIDGKANILHSNIIEHAHLARLRVNCNLRQMSRVHGRALLDGSTPTSIHWLIPAGEPHRFSSDFAQFDVSGGSAAHHNLVTLDLQVSNCRLQHFRSYAEHLV